MCYLYTINNCLYKISASPQKRPQDISFQTNKQNMFIIFSDLTGVGGRLPFANQHQPVADRQEDIFNPWVVLNDAIQPVKELRIIILG